MLNIFSTTPVIISSTPDWVFMEDRVNRRHQNPELCQRIFRNKNASGVNKEKDSKGLKELFVSSPFLTKAKEITVRGLHVFISLFSAF